jgi:peptide/nickel transport system substrate-binding protein
MRRRSEKVKKRVVFLIAGILVAAVLVLASCGPAAPTTAPPTGPGPTTAPPTTTAAKPTVETPKYGGTLNVLMSTDIISFDQGSSTSGGATLNLTNETLTGADWAKGPAGTNEVDWATPSWWRLNFAIGRLVDSWEVPELGTGIFHIRQGIHYALNPDSEASKLVNGREVTADDVAYNLTRYATSVKAFIRNTLPEFCRSANVTKTGPWEVTVKASMDFNKGFRAFMSYSTPILPPEVVQKYGDMQNWRNSVGTGPFMLTDFVAGSSATLIRNPNYWEKNPAGAGKGNQLPYLDKVNLLVVTDTSSRLAAIRTARADRATDVESEDAKGVMQTTPNLLYKMFINTNSFAIGMRTDKPDLPFKDKRVRQAMMMAIDFNSLKNDLYGGQAEILSWPATRVSGFENAYPTMDELPANVQELYSFHPDKAKQLLADAGYPNGFKTSVIIQNVSNLVDPISAIKDMWSKVGIDLTLDPRDYGVWTAIGNARSYSEMYVRRELGVASYSDQGNYRGGALPNISFVNDPVGSEPILEGYFQQMQPYVFTDWAKVDQIHKGYMPYLLEQAYVIPMPTPYLYTFWWPWVKNYHGEYQLDYTNNYNWIQYVWVDQDLKEQMTGRR